MRHGIVSGTRPTNKKQNFCCTPFTDPDREEQFILTINDQGLAELRHDARLITLLTLQDENPSPKN